MHDTVIELATMGGTEYGNTAFRFVRIDNREEDELELREICAVFLFRDLDYKGSFACDDPLLNRIFQTASYTLQLCMQDYLWDGAKRDRLIWMGDLHPEITAANVLFGETDVVKRSLHRSFCNFWRARSRRTVPNSWAAAGFWTGVPGTTNGRFMRVFMHSWSGGSNPEESSALFWRLRNRNAAAGKRSSA